MPVWKQFYAHNDSWWVFPATELQVNDLVVTKKSTRLILENPIMENERVAVVKTLDVTNNRVYTDRVSHFHIETQVVRNGEVIFDGSNPPERSF